MKPVDLQALDKLVRPAVEGQGYELVELEWKREQGSWIFRLYIDRRAGQGYVSHEDCVNVTREVGPLLDVHEALPGHYSLEVSSPGVNRPLKRKEDFERFSGQRAKVRLREEAGLPGPPGTSTPRRNFTGTIEAVEGERVRLRLEDGNAAELPISGVEKANLIFEF